jgi:hypothetical protein
MDLNEPDPIDFPNYKDEGGDSFAPPAEGTYMGLVGVIKDEDFGATSEGNLQLKVQEITITGDANGQATGKGYKVRFSTVNTKKWNDKNANSAVNFIRACGLDLQPNTNAEYVKALKMTAGRPVKFTLVHEGYDKETQTSYKGAAAFNNQPFLELTDTITEDGVEVEKVRRVYANGRAKYWRSTLVKK